MKDKEIAAFLKSIKLPEFTEAELPPLEDQVKFVETQIDAIGGQIYRTQFDIENFISYLKTKDQIAQEFAQGKLREMATTVKTLKLQLQAATELHAKLTQKA